MTTRAGWLGTLAALLALVLAAGCGTEESGSTREDDDATPRPTSVTSSRRSGEVTAEGRLVPVRQAILSADAAGIVEAVHVEEGDDVDAGDLLVEMDGARASAALLQAQAGLDAATAAGTGVDRAWADVELAQLAVDETRIVAPIDGTVAALDAMEGGRVAAGEALVYLADDSEWQVETNDVTEQSVVEVHVGDRAVVTFDALPDLEIEGRVVRVRGYGENKIGDVTYRVTIALDDTDPRLRWNMTASVNIETD